MPIICRGAFRCVTPGVNVPVTAPATGSGTGGNPYAVHGIMFQALPTNTGKVYIGTVGMVAATYVNVAAVLPVPTTNFLPAFSTSVTIAPNALTITEFVIDADNTTDGVVVTAVRV